MQEWAPNTPVAPLVIIKSRYIYDRKVEIIHGLSVKCVAPLFKDMFLAKV